MRGVTRAAAGRSDASDTSDEEPRRTLSHAALLALAAVGYLGITIVLTYPLVFNLTVPSPVISAIPRSIPG